MGRDDRDDGNVFTGIATALVGLCMAAVLVALTAKFVLWLF